MLRSCLVVFLLGCNILSACSDGEIKVEDVTLEDIKNDSSEFIEPPPPPDPSNTSQRLRLNYNAIACNCAQWSESKFRNDPEKREYIYLERANSSLINADSLWDGVTLPLEIEVTGNFRTGKSVPKDRQHTKGNPKAARIFEYESIKIISKGKDR